MSLEQIRKARKEYDNLVKTTGKQALLDEVKSFFEKFPEVTMLRWKGYAPSFNDGSPCYFSVHGPEIKLALPEGQAPDEEDEDDEFEGWVGYHTSIKDNKPLAADLSKLTRVFGELSDVIESVFGEGHQVVIHNNPEMTLENSNYYE